MARPFFLSSPGYTRSYPKIDVLGAFYQRNQQNEGHHVKVRNFLHRFKKKIASTDLLFPYFRSKMSSRCLKGPKTRQNRPKMDLFEAKNRFFKKMAFCKIFKKSKYDFFWLENTQNLTPKIVEKFFLKFFFLKKFWLKKLLLKKLLLKKLLLNFFRC